MFYNTTSDLQEQNRFFRSQTGLILRPMVSDHVTGEKGPGRVGSWVKGSDPVPSLPRAATQNRHPREGYESCSLRLRVVLTAVGVDLDEERLERLEERELWLVVVVAAAPACDCVSSLLSCSGRRIASSMSPITWKHGSTMKSIKPVQVCFIAQMYPVRVSKNISIARRSACSACTARYCYGKSVVCWSVCLSVCHGSTMKSIKPVHKYYRTYSVHDLRKKRPFSM